MSAIDDCWNKEGIYGSLQCAELKSIIHCRNCEVYENAAKAFFKREASEDYRQEWMKHLASPVTEQPENSFSVLVFRIGKELFCMASTCVAEITQEKPVHIIPHRSNNILRGIVNISGRVHLCVSVGALLGIEHGGTEVLAADEKRFKRMIAVKDRSDVWVFPVDTVYEMIRVSEDCLEKVPETAIHLYGGYTKAIIKWKDKPVGVIDEEMLFQGLARSL